MISSYKNLQFVYRVLLLQFAYTLGLLGPKPREPRHKHIAFGLLQRLLVLSVLRWLVLRSPALQGYMWALGVLIAPLVGASAFAMIAPRGRRLLPSTIRTELEFWAACAVKAVLLVTFSVLQKAGVSAVLLEVRLPDVWLMEVEVERGEIKAGQHVPLKIIQHYLPMGSLAAVGLRRATVRLDWDFLHLDIIAKHLEATIALAGEEDNEGTLRVERSELRYEIKLWFDFDTWELDWFALRQFRNVLLAKIEVNGGRRFCESTVRLMNSLGVMEHQVNMEPGMYQVKVQRITIHGLICTVDRPTLYFERISRLHPAALDYPDISGAIERGEIPPFKIPDPPVDWVVVRRSMVHISNILSDSRVEVVCDEARVPRYPDGTTGEGGSSRRLEVLRVDMKVVASGPQGGRRTPWVHAQMQVGSCWAYWNLVEHAPCFCMASLNMEADETFSAEMVRLLNSLLEQQVRIGMGTVKGSVSEIKTAGENVIVKGASVHARQLQRVSSDNLTVPGIPHINSFQDNLLGNSIALQHLWKQLVVENVVFRLEGILLAHLVTTQATLKYDTQVNTLFLSFQVEKQPMGGGSSEVMLKTAEGRWLILEPDHAFSTLSSLAVGVVAGKLFQRARDIRYALPLVDMMYSTGKHIGDEILGVHEEGSSPRFNLLRTYKNNVMVLESKGMMDPNILESCINTVKYLVEMSRATIQLLRSLA